MQYDIVKEVTTQENHKELPIQIGGMINRTINFAMQQNYVSAVRSIILTECAGKSWRDLTVHLSFEPAFAEEMDILVRRLDSYARVEIKPEQIVLNTEYLMGLTEKMVGNIEVSVRNGEETVSVWKKPIELLAYDQWSGSLFMPELLSAFVLPNHPDVIRIVNKAGTYMQKWKGSPSFLAYQEQDPNSVKMQIGAIYAALQEENIAYAVPPASYESVGQRIRLPQAITEQKMGTCLDLTLLYAGCLEAIGLHPLIVIEKEHAFVGCWLEEKTFAECIQDDVSALLKRMAEGMNELISVETTTSTAGKSVSFEAAVTAGYEKLIIEENFGYAVDVSRCRVSGIHPIPVRIMENGQYRMVDYGVRKAEEITRQPENLSTAGSGATLTKNEMTKQQLWERKLLDLSLRNTLLSFRVTKSAVQLLVDNPSVLEDELSKGEAFSIYPHPEDLEFPARENSIYAVGDMKNVGEQLVSTEFRNHRIRTFMDETELEQAMKHLHRSSKNSLEENGSNTLYLALGFLKWFENDNSKKERFAPLILVPVDIIRKIQEKSYQIKIRDEEAQMNITLLEMLRQDFQMDIGGLDPLPLDDNGIDIPLIFNMIRQGVMEKKRWDVQPLCFLGTFSFNRFIMWNDIRNRQQDIVTNKVVASLISGKMEWTPHEHILTAEELDDCTNPSEMVVPLSADSSQMVAICAAAQGQSFVLHGPPGTGKSQTITNMIANALYQGKSVLFVAEKMAALNVVQKRLERIGLSPFCLELHSNKSQKRAVLSQFEKTLETGRYAQPQEFAAKAAKINELRKHLNDVVREIHRKRECGFSLYELLSMYEGLNIYRGKLSFDEDFCTDINAERWECIMEKLKMFRAAAGERGRDSALSVFYLKDYSMQLRDTLVADMKQYLAELDILSQQIAAVRNAFAIDEPESANMLTFFDRLTVQCKRMDVCIGGLLNDADLNIQADNYRRILMAGVKRQAIKKELLKSFQEAVLGYDVVGAQNRYAQAEAKWVLAKASEHKALRKELQFYALKPYEVTDENILMTYRMLADFQAANAVITSEQAFLASHFGGFYRQEDTDYAKLGQLFEDNLALRNLISDAGMSTAVQSAVITTLSKNSDQRKEIFGEQWELLVAYEKARATTLATESHFMKDYAFRWECVAGQVPLVAKIKEIIQNCLNHMDGLRAQAAYVNCVEELRKLKLGEVAEAYEKGVLSPEDCLDAFRCNAARTIAMRLIHESDTLRQFTGTGFEESISQFRDVLGEFEVLSIRELVARLSSKIPQMGMECAQSSELGILQRAIKSGGRSMPIRKLFDRIPTLIRRLCPCMLMSPISVAQYIAPSFPKFDLVIFDEASQLPTGEAVGTLARGENAIVVGDPKQLPPTSFFISGKNAEEESDIDDMESLLDDCLTISMPQEHLRWHYRSRHESLIAYSNMTYYDNRLFTFPSPNDLVSQVKLIPVEGVYDRGKTKQNRAEAEAIIAEIIRRLQDEELRKDSIGVVTFSSVQQELIDDLLVEAFRANPELEQINQASSEPLFVKNLENVQGDERDVILFSVCYGPDTQGKVSMNFGPLNQNGGWRRLNVAISRSRKEMQIYSTLRHDQIQLERTASEGVAGLKGFLEFAAMGRNRIAIQNTSVIDKNTDLVASVAEEISLLGYEVKVGIGSSEYKIDIGVVHPDAPDTYCLGILCDSENYSLAETARDRNILQPSVLSSLGWKLHRVWILDWLDSPQREIEKIKTAIENALTGKQTTELAQQDCQPVLILDDNVQAVTAKQSYEICELPILGDSEDFYLPKSRMQIAKCIERVLTAEAPISKKLLEKRVISAWGMVRAGTKASDVIDEVMMTLPVQRTQTHGNTFFWLEHMNPMEYAIYRVSAEGATEARTFDEICAEEIAVAIREILNEQISLSREDVVRETAKRFGYTRVGAVIDTLVGIGIAGAEQRGFVTVSDDGQKITCKEGA